MGFVNTALSEISHEPIVLLFGIFVVYIIVVPILSFFMDFWFAFIILTVILILGWLAVNTVFKGQSKIGRGRLTNVP